MTYILLNSTYQFDVIKTPRNTQITKVEESGFINSAVEFQSIWTTDPKSINYELRCNNAERWILDQLLNAHSTITLYDSKFDTSIYVWLDNLVEKWDHNDSAKPWLVQASFTKIGDVT